MIRNERAERAALAISGIIATLALIVVLAPIAGTVLDDVNAVTHRNLYIAIATMFAEYLCFVPFAMPLILIAAGDVDDDSLVTTLEHKSDGVHVRFGAPWAFLLRLNHRNSFTRRKQITADVYATMARYAAKLSEAERAVTWFILTTDAIDDRRAAKAGLTATDGYHVRSTVFRLPTILLTLLLRRWNGGRGHTYRRWTISATHVFERYASLAYGSTSVTTTRPIASPTASATT